MLRRPRLKDSWGCLNCRRRKKKCDGIHPTCTACQRLHLTCEWQDQAAQVPGQPLTQRLNSTWTVPLSSPGGSSASVAAQNRAALARTVDNVPQEIDLSGFREQMSISHFINVNLNAGQVQPDELTAALTCSLRLPVLFLKTNQSTASSCLTACGLASLSRASNDVVLNQEATRQYVSCLRRVNALLGDRRMWNSIETHISVILLGMYEWLTSTDEATWIKHALGLARLVELRGPQSFTSFPDRLLFEYSRPQITSVAFLKRKKCFLSSHAWKNIPWALAEDHKTWQQSYIDISIDIPGCLEESDIFKEKIGSFSLDTRKVLLMRLFVKSSSIDRRLRRWRKAFERHNPNCMEDVSDSSLKSYKTISNTRKTYTSLAAAKRIIHYDTSLIIICGLLVEILLRVKENEGAYGTTVEPRSPPPLSPSRTEADSQGLVRQYGQVAYLAAIEICQSLEFVLLPEHFGAGSLYVIGPARVAQRCLGGNQSLKGQWIESVLDMMWRQYRSWQLTKAIKIQ